MPTMENIFEIRSIQRYDDIIKGRKPPTEQELLLRAVDRTLQKQYIALRNDIVANGILSSNRGGHTEQGAVAEAVVNTLNEYQEALRGVIIDALDSKKGHNEPEKPVKPSNAPSEESSKIPALSQAEEDVDLRRYHFLEYCPRDSSIFTSWMTCGLAIPPILSTFAVWKLWMQVTEMHYVAEHESRRKMNLPIESLASFVERKGLEKVRPPYFLCTFILIISAVFMVDIGLNDWSETPTQSRILVQLGGQSTEKILANHEWHRLLTHVLLHSTWKRLLWTSFFLFGGGVFLEMRHGSVKVAALATIATVASSIVGFALDPNSPSMGAFSVVCVILGMNYDGLLKWTLVHLGHCLFFVMYEFGSYRQCCRYDDFENLAGFFFGFSFMVPFCHQMTSSMILGKPPTWYWLLRRAVCVVCFTAATVGLFVALLGLLLMSEHVVSSEPLAGRLIIALRWV